MHIFDRDVRFMGGHGIVGGQIPLGTGIAWKIKYRGEDNVVVCFMGDAAVNQGAFHEALNMAAIWELPAIYVVENNEYGMGTAFRRVSLTEIVQKASPYGIPASEVDGQDVLATYAHFRDLAEEVRSGGGPRFVEVRTYRFRGHSMSDPVSGTYRSKDEVEQHTQEQDPIVLLRERLFDGGHLDQDDARGDGRRGAGDRRRCGGSRAKRLRRPVPTRCTSTCGPIWTCAADCASTGGRACHGCDDLPRGAQPGAARGDGARPGRLPHGRGGRRVRRRLQGVQGAARDLRRHAAWWIRRSASSASPGWASAPPWPACVR